jgi:branched-chain amino acid transport system substrate-binding protein
MRLFTSAQRRGVALAAVVLLGAACAAPGGSDDDSASGDGGSGGGESQVLRIGVLAPTTGNLAAAGNDLVKGWELFWEQNGTTVAGTEVEWQVEDDAGDPSVALTKVDRLVDDFGADAIVGPILANVGLAVIDSLKREGVASVPQTSADNITQRVFDPLVARVGSSASSQSQHPAGAWAYEQGYRKVVTICPDYAFGHENCGGFSRTFKEAGGEVVTQLWNPLGTQDFSTYVTQIQSARPDLLYVAQTGGDAANFVKAWSEFGLKGQIPFLGNSTILEQSVLRSLGDEALGLQSFSYYAEGRDAEPTEQFVAAFQEAHGEIPSVYAASAYSAAEWIATALEEADGDLGKGEELINAIEAVEVETPLGPMSLDEYNNPDLNVYLREVQRRDDGTLWNVPVETFENVSQFYTFDPEEYLKQPVYSRDYQG